MLKRFFHNEQGVALVELALVMPVLLILMMGVFEIGRLSYWRMVVVDSTHDGAEYASISKTTDYVIGGYMRQNLQAALGEAALASAGTASAARYFCVCSKAPSVRVADPCSPTQTINCPGSHELHYVTVTTDLQYQPAFPAMESLFQNGGGYLGLGTDHIRNTTIIQLAG